MPGKATRFKPGDKKGKVEAGRKGGLVKSEAKKLAALKRSAKKIGITKETASKAFLLASSKELTYAVWLKYIDLFIEAAEKEPRLLALIPDKLRDYTKQVHGDANKSQVNIQINNVIDKESVIKRLLDEDHSEIVDEK